MRISNFEWDEDNISHIGRHNVSPEEVEEACYLNPCLYRAKGRNRYIVLGRSQNGRYLTTVVENQGQGRARVVTARDMTIAERKTYWRK